MNVVLVYLRMYADVFANTGKALIKAPWTLILPVVYFVVVRSLFGLIAGLVGERHVAGFIIGLLDAAAISAYLYYLGEVVSKSTTSLKELRKSFGIFFWSVIGVRFVFWIAELLLGGAMPDTAQSEGLLKALWLVAYIALNAMPETIYVKGTLRGLDTIMASFQFLQEHWIEWLIPNAVLLAIGWKALQYIPYDTFGYYSSMILLGALLHIAMVFRGTLYVALDGSTHRQRMFKYRNASEK